jgi:hypothetical protein
MLEGKTIAIISGEGTVGSVSLYEGKNTVRAIKARLTRERCNGDRWARAIVYKDINDYGAFGYDIETGAPCSFPEELLQV